jgi:hypothetical protein
VDRLQSTGSGIGAAAITATLCDMRSGSVIRLPNTKNPTTLVREARASWGKLPCDYRSHAVADDILPNPQA